MTANGGTVTYEKSYFVIQPQISFSIIEQSTGYVKVLVGGRGDKATDRGLNRATDDVTRQPGSLSSRLLLMDQDLILVLSLLLLLSMMHLTIIQEQMHDL